MAGKKLYNVVTYHLKGRINIEIRRESVVAEIPQLATNGEYGAYRRVGNRGGGRHRTPGEDVINLPNKHHPPRTECCKEQCCSQQQQNSPSWHPQTNFSKGMFKQQTSVTTRNAVQVTNQTRSELKAANSTDYRG